MRDLIEKQIGNEIGINLHGAHSIEPARVVSASEAYFTVETAHDNNLYHVPYPNIVKIIENPDGVTVSGFFRSHKMHPFVVKIGHVVEYVPT